MDTVVDWLRMHEVVPEPPDQTITRTKEEAIQLLDDSIRAVSIAAKEKSEADWHLSRAKRKLENAETTLRISESIYRRTLLGNPFD